MADISITAANFIPSANATTQVVTSGATATRGQTAYLDTSTSTYKLFDADGTGDAKNFAGFFCEDVASGQQFLLCTKDPALALGGTIGAGDTLWGSATAGGVTKTAGDLASGMKIWSLGVGTASGIVNFEPVAGGVKP